MIMNISKRIEIYNDKHGIAFGWDRAVGNFIQVWKLDPEHSSTSIYNQPDDDNLVVDSDESQSILTKEEMQTMAKVFKFDISEHLKTF